MHIFKKVRSEVRSNINQYVIIGIHFILKYSKIEFLTDYIL